jgi:putative oxidoreductase
MTDRANEPALLLPGLAGFYAWASDFSYLVVRATVGGILFVHGWGKLHVGIHGIAGFMTKVGFVPGTLFAGAAMFLETVGAICIVIGLFTRFFAAAIAIELLCITLFISGPHGFGFTAPGGGYEYPLMWGLIMFAVALRGGGPYSVDRAIGKEL